MGNQVEENVNNDGPPPVVKKRKRKRLKCDANRRENALLDLKQKLLTNVRV